MGWFEDMVSMDGRLKGKERSERRLLFIISVFIFVSVLYSCVTIPDGQMTSLVLVHSSIVFVTTPVIFVQCLFRFYITKRMVQIYVVMWTASICFIHLHNQTVSLTPRWSLFVMMLDLSLVMRLGRTFATYLAGFILFWIALMQLELQFRFGLLDFPGSADTSHRLEELRKVCDCTSPPCPKGVSFMLLDMVVFCLVIVVDFLATRGFADEAEKERASMARTIETVEAAAQLLAGYDVDTVAELLEAAEERLPPAMHAALQRLEQNLRSYRPYLPVALFERVPGDSDMCRSPALFAAPGTESAEATLVFTDIRASTAVWEAAPEAMQKAIRTHNVVMRAAISLFGGYEVKTIGDAFMVAFEGPCAGVDFGLSVQEALLAADWPAALLEVPICRRVDEWGGLTVRVGVNHGPVMTETNMLTGRVDYFGHTVNVASRLESTCVPGAVAVPSAMWSQVCGACAPAVAGDEAVTDLKGVSEAVRVRNLWPASLAGRATRRLPEGPSDGASATVSRSSVSSRHGRVRSDHPAADVLEKHATIGVLSLKTVDSSSVHNISDCLEAVTPLLQQSHGALVSLLGEHLFTGWNLVQPVSVHAENAVQFVRRALRAPLGESMTAGLASGTVYHGDVGTRSQRFVTVAGPTVAASLQVWHTAHQMGHRFLYTPGEGVVLVCALQAVLVTTQMPQSDISDTLGTLYELGPQTHENLPAAQQEY